MQTEITDAAAIGKTIREFTFSFTAGQMIVHFDDGTFTVFGIDGTYDPDIVSQKLALFDFGDDKLVRANILSAEELEKKRAERTKRWKQIRELRDRRRYEEPKIDSKIHKPECAFFVGDNMTTDLVEFSVDERALAEIQDPGELKDWRDKTEAVRQYVKNQGVGLDGQNRYAEAKIWIERRLGQVLGDMPKAKGAAKEGWKTRFHDATALQLPTLADLGIAKTQSHRWQAIASLPEEILRAYIAEIKSEDEELTSKGVYRLAQKLKKELKREREIPVFLEGEYRVIYADPPWQFSNSGFDQSAAAHYPTMATNEICDMPIDKLIPASEGSVLFLWATNAMLEDAFQVVAAWGFEYKTNLVWVKDKAPGMGWFVKNRHELLLLATNSPGLHPQEKPFSIIEAPVTKHSKKPDCVYEMIERMYDGPYIELFARMRREGWDSWGNEL